MSCLHVGFSYIVGIGVPLVILKWYTPSVSLLGVSRGKFLPPVDCPEWEKFRQSRKLNSSKIRTSFGSVTNSF